ncbi:RNA polymerase III RPC4 domain containing protein [Naviculisporaceae sp. PSN 640]
MPPRATGRGRGRGGRGRGASSAVSAAVASASGDAPNTAAAAEPSNTPEPAAAPEPTIATDAPASTAPPASNTAPSASTSQATPSAKPTGSAKFKPKAIRRSEAERARRAEEVERAHAQRYAEESKLQATPYTRGRGRGRGRGGLLRGAGRQMISGGMSFGSLSGGGSSSTGGYGQATEYDGERKVGSDGRINADAFYGYVPNDDQEEQTTGAFVRGPSKKKAMMPMGIRRVEHTEDTVTMATAAEIEAQDRGEAPGGGDSDSELFVDNGGSPKGEAGADDSVWEHAVPKSHGQVQIKQEPVDGDVMDLDMPEGKLKTPDSPELGKKDLAGADQKKKKKKQVVKDPEEEWNAAQIERMLDLFTLREGAGLANQLEGHMFLFQFPAVLPKLKPVGGSIVKPEPQDDDDELFVSNDPPKMTANIDLTGPDSDIKKEGDEQDEAGSAENDNELKETGFVGNLIVRKSGKVELNWGGNFPLVVEPGIPSNFFSQAVLIEEGDVKPGQTVDFDGTAYGMGRIQGKFTAAPVWQGEEEWEISEEDLEWDMH